jgi:5-methylthioadenosine/S-adenosylhomocysteine deaminase
VILAASVPPSLVIRNGTVITMDRKRRIVRGDIHVTDGQIRAVVAGTRKADGSARGATVLDATDCLVIPGLVQTHVHLCQTLFRGRADDLPLLKWLRTRIWPFEAALDEASLRTSAQLGLLELLLGGTTTILDMGTVHHQDIVFEAMEQAGVRGFSGKSMMDVGQGLPKPMREGTRASLDETDRLAAAWHGAAHGRLGYAVAPRFILSCSRELLEGARDLALRHRAPIHTHAAEHPDEVAAVRRTTGKTSVRALHDLGLTGTRSIFAHCVHLTPADRKLLAETKTAVAHCPSANLKLGSGIADIVALRRAEVTVGIGADGAACNNLLCAWTEMRLAGLLASVRHGPGVLTAADLLAIGTIDGAKALGLERVIGSLEPGKRADLVVIAPDHTVEPAEDPYARLIWSGRACDVRDVVIDGRIVVRNRECLTLDADSIRAHAKQHARRIASHV